MKSKYWLAPAFLAFVLSCSSDPEGPISGKFVDDGTYGVKAGKARRVVFPVNAGTVSVPLGVGTNPLLTLGRVKGIEYRSILLKFNFTLAAEDSGKTISSAVLHLPVQVATPEDLKMPVTVHELLSSFSDADTITAVPPYDLNPIADSLGRTVDTLDIAGINDFSLDTTVVGEWLSGRRVHNGIAILWASAPDSASYFEMNARERGTNPPSVVVQFRDSTSATFAAAADYSVVVFEHGGLNCLGGVARRIQFGFEITGIPADSAMINAAFLVLTVQKELGFGATLGEQVLLGYSSLFQYYLYAPVSTDTLSSDFRKGTGVDTGIFEAVASATIKMPLRGYIRDILSGARANTGLVLQSDQELRRIQRASFASTGADKPYLEIIYSLPADFGGSR